MLTQLTAIRIELLHLRASRDRWYEELRLLRAESARVGKTFQHYALTWQRRREEWEEDNDGKGPGYAAYCARERHVFETLAQNAIRVNEHVESVAKTVGL